MRGQLRKHEVQRTKTPSTTPLLRAVFIAHLSPEQQYADRVGVRDDVQKQIPSLRYGMTKVGVCNGG